MMFPKPTYQKKDKTSEWKEIRAELKDDFKEVGLTHCEAGLVGCTYEHYLGFAHLDKRIHVDDLKEVVLLCTNCHQAIEYTPRPVMRAYLEKLIAIRPPEIKHKLELLETGGKI